MLSIDTHCIDKPAFEIRPLSPSPEIRSMLGELLIDVVADGGSVGFMHPLSPEQAQAFWHASLAAAELGARIVLGAFDQDRLVGTVTLLLDCPPNQPHRGEIAKLMTRRDHRGRGVASSLVRTAETLAREHRRALLVLDTASDEGASAFYEKLGYTRAGEIPDYALKPHGGLTGTIIFWKKV
ncbi:acetyltransferase family protein [Lysobacter antibioticus]|uniref:GNAT family N-acetyltransferase n=1 Tax=Lysobacter antibioticus TaxID=84531 RepID=UPI0007174F73|nr:GNAT family N-acetyltransferase [Lysobacter antibioticus]ALN62492.1 acetyltransferase family protein [Lysobacter antibioticus]